MTWFFREIERGVWPGTEKRERERHESGEVVWSRNKKEREWRYECISRGIIAI
jgi:hypothetical protein